MNDKVQARYQESEAARRSGQEGNNLRDSLHPNVEIPPEIKTAIHKELEKNRFAEYRSGKDFGSKSSYPTEEIGLIVSGGLGPSFTGTMGIVGADEQETGKWGGSFGGVGLGAYAGMYGIETDAPYEVWKDPKTKVLSIGFVGGAGPVTGFNYLSVAGSDGQQYSGRMTIFGGGIAIPGLPKDLPKEHFLGSDIGAFGGTFPLPSHYN